MVCSDGSVVAVARPMPSMTSTVRRVSLTA
jgi:hypothetical protein